MVPVVSAANRIPIARRVHALPAVVGRRPKILRPEKWLVRLVNEHRVVRNRPAIVVQIIRTLGLGGGGCAVDYQISMMKNRELILIQVLMFREIGTGGELNPGRIRAPSVAHHQISNATE